MLCQICSQVNDRYLNTAVKIVKNEKVLYYIQIEALLKRLKNEKKGRKLSFLIYTVDSFAN